MSSPESREDWIAREARQRLPGKRLVFLDGSCPENTVVHQALPTAKSRDAPIWRETGVVRPALRSDLAGTLDEAVRREKQSSEALHP